MKNYYNKQNHKYDRGFTIVETLVAIAILMISIAGPLTVAQKGLTASIYARDQSIATFLAQDAMEYLKNSRDNYFKINTFPNWYYSFSGCTFSSQCNIDTTINNISPVYDNFLLYHDGIGYKPNGTIASQFSRNFYIIEMQKDIEIKVVVIVTWQNGTISNSVTLEDYFFNVRL